MMRMGERGGEGGERGEEGREEVAALLTVISWTRPTCSFLKRPQQQHQFILDGGCC